MYHLWHTVHPPLGYEDPPGQLGCFKPCNSTLFLYRVARREAETLKEGKVADLAAIATLQMQNASLQRQVKPPPPPSPPPPLSFLPSFPPPLLRCCGT